jgi:acyl-CoA thioester hydrolase
MEISIYYEDTDCGNVVYYANYLRYMERGRTEYLAGKSVSIKGLMEGGTVFVVSRAEIDYRSSARYGDVIVLETTIAERTGATIQFSHRMTDKATGRLLVEGTIRMVCTDLQSRPKRIPQEMVDRLS